MLRTTAAKTTKSVAKFESCKTKHSRSLRTHLLFAFRKFHVNTNGVVKNRRQFTLAAAVNHQSLGHALNYEDTPTGSCSCINVRTGSVANTNV
jgi:hypothetical protein